jgi:glycosyltransferase involved in cell wall biosynthesis
MHLLQLRSYQVPILLHDHHYCAGFEALNVSSTHRFRLMLKLFYGFSDHVLAVSQGQADWMEQRTLVSPQKLQVIQQCIPVDQCLAVEPKPLYGSLVLGTYGRFCPQKGLDILLEAMRFIPKHVAVHLQIGGGGSPAAESKLKALAQGLENVTFWGWVDDVPAFLRTCDVMVIPSRWEPWGNVCVEAKAAGKPVIASDVDGLSEQIQGCGMLVPSQNPQELAQAIRAIAALSPQELEVWGKTGRASVEKAWEIYLERWEQLLWQVIRSRSSFATV